MTCLKPYNKSTTYSNLAILTKIIMNRFPLIALLALLLLACKKDKASDPAPVQPKLPPATQTGANTFGCYVNGKPFIQEQDGVGRLVGTQLNEITLARNLSGWIPY